MTENEMTARTRKGYARTIDLVLMAFCLAFVWSCESKDSNVGRYVAVKKDIRREEISLQLNPNGEGLWIMGDKEVAFTWYVKHGDLRINAKEGGVLVGKLMNGRIKINFPVQGEMLFQRTE